MLFLQVRTGRCRSSAATALSLAAFAATNHQRSAAHVVMLNFLRKLVGHT